MSDEVFVIGGGTGGHLFPAIAVVEEFGRHNIKATLVTDNRCVKYLQNHQNLKTHIIAVPHGHSGIFGKVTSIYFMLRSLISAFLLLYKAKPALVIGFGGYVTYPLLAVSRIFGIPIILHEQNCFLGKVNNLFAKRAEKLCIAFENTANIPKDLPQAKIIITGNPVRKEILEYIAPKVKTKEDIFKILVTGGSQGAAFLSSIMPEAINLVQKNNPKIKIEIIQQSRPEDIENIKKAYAEYNINAHISDFFYNMPELLYNADLLIGRAGAATIAELIAITKPAILIPYPFAAEKHQHFNAEMVQKNGGGWFFDQYDLTKEIIADKIIEIICNKKILYEASLALKKLQKDSANIIVNTAEKIIHKSVEKA